VHAELQRGLHARRTKHNIRIVCHCLSRQGREELGQEQVEEGQLRGDSTTAKDMNIVQSQGNKGMHVTAQCSAGPHTTMARTRREYPSDMRPDQSCADAVPQLTCCFLVPAESHSYMQHTHNHLVACPKCHTCHSYCGPLCVWYITKNKSGQGLVKTRVQQ
jgi:hypothetical protein